MASAIGVLSLQGDVAEHCRSIEALGRRAIQIRYARQMDSVDGLIIPGGESTTIAKLTADNADAIFDRIREFIDAGKPVYGTCMGSIFLAKEIEGSAQGRLAAMDIKVRRNAFGPQRFSFETTLNIPVLGEEPLNAIFIRGPVILSASENVEVMARVDANIGRLGKTAGSLPGESALYDSCIVMARQNNLLVSSFHPELTDDLRVHHYFLQMVEGLAPAKVSKDFEQFVHTKTPHTVNPMTLAAV
ncbi:MAG: pyridoxal 5'-phosphate synthase glutaminase subunit PdxT [Candidatus Melainabacteria bacterium]|nr:pyridoxal 5'-phosphate synthase glutaminase subunit PdxT [Candidatus Melainabacteria bacterium]